MATGLCWLYVQYSASPFLLGLLRLQYQVTWDKFLTGGSMDILSLTLEVMKKLVQHACVMVKIVCDSVKHAYVSRHFLARDFLWSILLLRLFTLLSGEYMYVVCVLGHTCLLP